MNRLASSTSHLAVCRAIVLLALIVAGGPTAVADSVTLTSGELLRAQILRFEEQHLHVLIPSATGITATRAIPIDEVAAFLIERDEMLDEVFETPENLDARTVVAVVSGDTVVLDDGETIRYMGIQAPRLPPAVDRPEPLARDAREQNEKWVLNKPVQLDYEDPPHRDEQGFLHAYVYAEGKFINAELLKRGLASVSKKPRPRKHDVTFLKIQDDARMRSLGLWALPGRFAPEGDATETVRNFVSNRNSTLYHLESCEWAKGLGPQTRVEFGSREEAELSGRTPCPVCLGALLE